MCSSSEEEMNPYIKEELVEELNAWDSATRKSAFSPYRPVTILTNLQRGNTETQASQPPPFVATFHSKAAMGALLMDNIMAESDVDVVDSNGLSALMWGAAYGQLPTCKLLLQKQASIDFEGDDGETALLLASANGHHEVVRLLLNYGADPNHVDHMSNTALMFAAHGDHAHCVAELIENGADLTLTNMEGDSAFNIAVKMGCKQAQIVLERFILRMLEPP